MSDLTSKTVDELRDDLIYGATCDGIVDEVAVSRFDELARRLEEAQRRSEAHDAEVAAKALEELKKEIYEKEKSNGLENLWIIRLMNRIIAEYRAKAGRKK